MKKSALIPLFMFLASPVLATHNGGAPTVSKSDPYWFDRYEVALAAHEFSEEAEHFHNQVEHEYGYTHLASDAHRLSEAAEHFHDAVESGRSYYHLLNDYRRLNNDYHHLVIAWRRAHWEHHNWHLQHDFDQMDRAFRRLRWSMQGGHHGGGHDGGHGDDWTDHSPKE